MLTQHATLDRIAQHQKGRTMLRLIARAGFAVAAIEDTLAREITKAANASRTAA